VHWKTKEVKRGATKKPVSRQKSVQKKGIADSKGGVLNVDRKQLFYKDRNRQKKRCLRDGWQKKEKQIDR